MEQEENSMDLSEIIQIIRKRKAIVIWTTLLTVLLTIIVVNFLIKPTYEADTSVIIGKLQSSGNNSQVNYSDVMMYQTLMKTYAGIGKVSEVSENTIKDLNLNIKPSELIDGIKITPQASTQIIDIKVLNKDPEMALKIANAFTTNFIKKSNELLPSSSMSTLENATMPQTPVKPKKKLDIAIAFFLGLMVSVGIIFLIEYTDNTIKTDKDVERALGIPVIGIIPLDIRK